MIKEDYVNFETARLLKEKGFNEKVICYYDDGGSLNLNKFVEFQCCNQGYGSSVFAAPTLQMTMKWLRREYNIHIEPRYFPMPNIYRYVIIRSPFTIENIDSHPQYFNSYEQAVEEAIKYCLENLI